MRVAKGRSRLISAIEISFATSWKQSPMMTLAVVIARQKRTFGKH
ncbi:MAG TPA: hypothetical protein VGX71_10690 [Pseudaminobacter sp.]|nr:hypothetical protein [Pseudaminobacter sp.]